MRSISVLPLPIWNVQRDPPIRGHCEVADHSTVRVDVQQTDTCVHGRNHELGLSATETGRQGEQNRRRWLRYRIVSDQALHHDLVVHPSVSRSLPTRVVRETGLKDHTTAAAILDRQPSGVVEHPKTDVGYCNVDVPRGVNL